MTNYQVIDSDDYAASGIDAFFFPGGEPHVKIPLIERDTLLFLKLRTWSDVGLAAVLMDAVYRQFQLARNDVYAAHPRVEAFIPYLPGARQDRSDGHSPLTREVIGSLFCYGGILRHVFDVHSREGCFQYTNWMPADLDLSSLRDKYEGVLAPDAGAIKRAEGMAAALGLYVVGACEKVREFSTGKITSYKVPELELGCRYLVVDDICDGGATFNILADSVPEGVQLDLWVSHGIFSKGVDNISTRYGTIYTTDSFFGRFGLFGFTHPTVKVLPLEPLFNKIMES